MHHTGELLLYFRLIPRIVADFPPKSLAWFTPESVADFVRNNQFLFTENCPLLFTDYIKPLKGDQFVRFMHRILNIKKLKLAGVIGTCPQSVIDKIAEILQQMRKNGDL